VIKAPEPVQFPDWVKIPVSMQHQFFELAAKEAEKTKVRLLEHKKRLEQLRSSLKFSKIAESDEWKDWRIAYVDGSDSPVLSERIGGRYGTYSAGWNLYRGFNLEGESYFSGKMVDFETGDLEASKKTLDLLAASLERDISLKCLEEEKPDLIVIDGSFFGYQTRSRLVRERRINQDQFELGSDLVRHLVDSTSKLLQSGRAVGVVKRVATAAIDGWIIKRDGTDQNVFHSNDRHLLSSLMTSGQLFSYSEMFGDPTAYVMLTRLASRYRKYTAGGMGDVDTILRQIRSEIDSDIKRNLACSPDTVLATERYYLRTDYPAPPFCLEAKTGMDLEHIIPYLSTVHNPATGLPLPLDMIDQNVGLPRGFTREFVEEIEANLVRDAALDKLDLQNHFAYLNPQKQE
jgi:hypothetical protein